MIVLPVAELTRAAELSEKLLGSMPAHVTSQSFSWHVLVQMLAINLFAMHHVTRQSDGSPENSPNKKDVLSAEEERSFEIVFNFTGICTPNKVGRHCGLAVSDKNIFLLLL